MDAGLQGDGARAAATPNPNPNPNPNPSPPNPSPPNPNPHPNPNQVLEPLLQGDGKGGETFASDLREHHTEQKVAFT